MTHGLYRRLYGKGLLLLALWSVTLVSTSIAQKRKTADVLRMSVNESVQRVSVAPTSGARLASLPSDTLRNFDPSIPVALPEPADLATPIDSGWVHGTNAFLDFAKATRLTLPGGASEGVISEVLVTFVHKASTVTNQTYTVEIHAVDLITGSPGSVIASQTFNMADVAADDAGTIDLRRPHVFDIPVTVPSEFFVVVDFGSYGPGEFFNLAIGATDRQQRFVEEDWELWSDGSWNNMSSAWFTNANDGWLMWIEAVMTSPGDGLEPNNTASTATGIQDGFVSSGTTINPIGDIDYYSFTATTGATVDIFTQNEPGSTLDGAIALYNSGGVLIASNDDFNDDTNQSRVVATLDADDTYYIRYSYFEDETGDNFPNKRGEEGSGGVVQQVLGELRSIQSAEKMTRTSAAAVVETGAYTLTFSATPGGGNIDSTPPTIQHTVPNPVIPEGEDLVVQADFIDESGIAAAVIVYFQGGRSLDDFDTVIMSSVGGNTFEGTIPGAAVTTRGLQYALGATDGASLSSGLGPFNVRIATEGLSRDLNVSGTDASAYRLLSFPLDIDANTVSAILEDDLGPYDDTVWRFFQLNSDQSYSEFPTASAVAQGTAYWLAVSEPGLMINTGPGSSRSLSAPFTKNLNAGWTFIGTPYDFPVGLNQLTLSTGAALDIRAYNGSWGSHNGPLQPFAGYAIASDAADQLAVSPFLEGVNAAKTAPGDSPVGGGELLWAIQIEATGGNARDNDNVAAVAERSKPGRDEMDRPEPPVIGEYVSLYFPHEDWKGPFRRFNTDVRPSFEDLESWQFEVSTTLTEPITLTFSGLDEVPAAFEVVLVDRLLHHEQDLRQQPAYTFKPGGAPYAERFDLLVGKADVIAEDLASAQGIPDQITLGHFPNPFRTNTTIQFGLPAADRVSLHVYDLLGKRVSTLIDDEPRSEGMHAIQWEGRDLSGRPLASGVYLYALQVGARRTSKQVVVIR